MSVRPGSAEDPEEPFLSDDGDSKTSLDEENGGGFAGGVFNIGYCVITLSHSMQHVNHTVNEVLFRSLQRTRRSALDCWLSRLRSCLSCFHHSSSSSLTAVQESWPRRGHRPAGKHSIIIDAAAAEPWHTACQTSPWQLKLVETADTNQHTTIMQLHAGTDRLISSSTPLPLALLAMPCP